VICSCEHGNESSGSVKGGKIFDQMSDLVSQGLCSMELVMAGHMHTETI